MTPPPRSSGAILLLTVLAMLALAAAVAYVALFKDREERFTDSGLNLVQVDDAPAPPAEALPRGRAPGTRPPYGGPSTIAGLAADARRKETGPGSRAAELARRIRASEPRFEALAHRYSRKHPVIREYGRDWMLYPDLRRYNDEYFRDRNPIKFAWNVASSKNFAALARKYAARPEIHAFLQDALRAAPPELLGSLREYLKAEENTAALLRRFSRAAGLPDSIVAALAGSASGPPPDAAALIRSDPNLRELLRRQGIDPQRLLEEKSR